jgi:hypothetical protein
VNTPHSVKPSVPTGTDSVSTMQLQLLLHDIEISGSTAPRFWRHFWDVQESLTDGDLERLAWAVGRTGAARIRIALALRSVEMHPLGAVGW